MRPIYFFSIIASLVIPQIADSCEPNPYSYAIITREDWTEIKKITKSTSITINREYVSKYDISSIIGFSGQCSSDSSGRTEECIWIDGQNCKKKIKARFRDSQLSTIRKSGF